MNFEEASGSLMESSIPCIISTGLSKLATCNSSVKSLFPLSRKS